LLQGNDQVEACDAACIGKPPLPPQMDHPDDDASHRVLNVHKNVPGVLRDVNRIISDLDANIKAQVPWPCHDNRIGLGLG